jgi:hypothetical protein
MKTMHAALLFCAILLAPAVRADEAALHGHDHAAQGAGHHHAKLNVEAESAPRIRPLRVEADPVGGFNLYLEVERFTFAPALVNGPHKPGYGHAHLYVDGVKLARLYAPAYHIASLDPGSHDIVVTLNANDHRALAVGDIAIAATATVTVP